MLHTGITFHHHRNAIVIGYISDNLLLPILDFFYGLVPSYGLAIVALTVVIRLALFHSATDPSAVLAACALPNR